MRVLTICTVRFRLNGITSVILNYYRNMDRTNMQIDFVVHNEICQEYRDELRGNGSNIYMLPRKSNPLEYMKQLKELLKKNQYDIVHIHGNSAMMMVDVWPAFLARVPVRIVHCHSTSCEHVTMHKLLLPFFKRCYTHGFACGQDAGKWLYGDGKFVELKNGIHMDTYAYDLDVRMVYREKIGAGNATVIGHVGNFIPQKNHTFLIDWFAELLKKNEQYKLLFISDGELMEAMQQKVERLGIGSNVIFLGNTTEVNCYYQAMDMLVLPSLVEGLPVVLIEAQANGLPCLVSDRVAKEANLTKELTYLPIDDTQVWVDEVIKTTESISEINRMDACRRGQKCLAEAGYDVVKNASVQRTLYEQYVLER